MTSTEQPRTMNTRLSARTARNEDGPSSRTRKRSRSLQEENEGEATTRTHTPAATTTAKRQKVRAERSIDRENAIAESSRTARTSPIILPPLPDRPPSANRSPSLISLPSSVNCSPNAISLPPIQSARENDMNGNVTLPSLRSFLSIDSTDTSGGPSTPGSDSGFREDVPIVDLTVTPVRGGNSRTEARTGEANSFEMVNLLNTTFSAISSSTSSNSAYYAVSPSSSPLRSVINHKDDVVDLTLSTPRPQSSEVIIIDDASPTPSPKPPKPASSDAPRGLQIKCAICLDWPKDISATSCGHIFCRECIRTAVRAQRMCSLCRHPLTRRQIKRLEFKVM
ncbi:2800_t:CDS:2 [Paraglomus brasilianum]|uniref:2800_t:CDS:1 n=1 Tax=Paraglomus brasilianum TaxID=144538 RepID=A0A9N8VXL6_9GLOM|nr:2800_t:CDS:2 [Paraglomus brasilianum]